MNEQDKKYIDSLSQEDKEQLRKELYSVVGCYYTLKQRLKNAIHYKATTFDELLDYMKYVFGTNSILRADNDNHDFIDIQGYIANVYTISFRKDTNEIVLDEEIEFEDINGGLWNRTAKEFENILFELEQNKRG